jgi:Sel1 repeat-containing protein
MLAQCPKCGFENIAQNRFCGMCGAQLIAPVSTPVSSPAIPTSGIPSSPVRAPLQESPSQRLRTDVPPQRTSSILGLGDVPPARATPPVRESPSERIQSQAARTSQPRERSVPVSGPSFLGLSDEPARDLDYLLEDEEPTSGHKSMSIVFLLLLAGVIYAGWRWRAEIYPRATQALHRVEAIIAPSSSTNSAQTPTEPPPASTTDSHTITPQDERSATEPDKTEARKQLPGAGTSAPATPASSASPSSTAASSGPTSSEPTSQTKAVETGEAQTTESSDSAESTAKPDDTTAETETAPVKNTKPRAAVPKSANREIQPATSSDISDEKLVADGEKYLYGTGVPENCGRAQKSLQTAAQHSNSKAQAMLGTMYFTGHCATRDLPTAYRWFARALHGDPGNSRLQQDLEILWKAMTPDERQLATRRE